MRFVNTILVLSVLANAGLIFVAAGDRGRFDGAFLVYFGGMILLALGALIYAREKSERGIMPKLIGLLALILTAINFMFFLDVMELGAAAMALVLFEIITGLLIAYKCFPAIKKFISIVRELDKQVNKALSNR